MRQNVFSFTKKNEQVWNNQVWECGIKHNGVFRHLIGEYFSLRQVNSQEMPLGRDFSAFICPLKSRSSQGLSQKRNTWLNFGSDELISILYCIANEGNHSVNQTNNGNFGSFSVSVVGKEKAHSIWDFYFSQREKNASLKGVIFQTQRMGVFLNCCCFSGTQGSGKAQHCQILLLLFKLSNVTELLRKNGENVNHEEKENGKMRMICILMR